MSQYHVARTDIIISQSYVSMQSKFDVNFDVTKLPKCDVSRRLFFYVK